MKLILTVVIILGAFIFIVTWNTKTPLKLFVIFPEIHGYLHQVNTRMGGWILLPNQYSAAYSLRKKPDWSFMVFSQSWPAGFCSFEKCSYPRMVDGFNIHGLWPTIWPNIQISNCTDAPEFNSSALAPIFDELQHNWANLKDFDSPLKFWHHEWLKHGTCAIEDKIIPDQFSYFKAALKLRQQIGLDRIFEENNFKQSNVTEYSTETVSDVLRNKLGVSIVLQCEWIHEEIARLIEVRVCIGKQLNLIDCPPTFPAASWTAPCPESFIISA